MRSPRGARVAICSAGGPPADPERFAVPLSEAGFLPERLPGVDAAIEWSTAGGCDDALLLIWRASRAAAGEADPATTVRRLRSRGFASLILVLAEAAPASQVAAVLDSGADEYVRLPCDPVEVVARLRALVRRSCGQIPLGGSDRQGPIFDRWRHVVTDGETEVALTPREAALLECLAQRAGRPVTREELAACVWGAGNLERTATNIVDVYVAYLRRKLGALGRAALIRSVRGIGYELASEPGQSESPASASTRGADLPHREATSR